MNLFMILGAALIMVVALIDRMLVPIRNAVFIPLCIAGIALVVIGIIRNKIRDRKEEEEEE